MLMGLAGDEDETPLHCFIIERCPRTVEQRLPNCTNEVLPFSGEAGIHYIILANI